MKAIQKTGGRINCDNCNTVLKEVSPDNIKEVEEFIGKPCPNCGAPDVVTLEDYASILVLFKIIDMLNEILPEADGTEKMQEVSIKIGNNKKNE